MSTTTAMSRTAETCRAQRYSDGGWRSSPTRSVHGEEPVVHEPRDDDGTGDEPEQVAGDPEEGELEGVHRPVRVGRADAGDPARR